MKDNGLLKEMGFPEGSHVVVLEDSNIPCNPCRKAANLDIIWVKLPQMLVALTGDGFLVIHSSWKPGSFHGQKVGSIPCLNIPGTTHDFYTINRKGFSPLVLPS